MHFESPQLDYGEVLADKEKPRLPISSGLTLDLGQQSASGDEVPLTDEREITEPTRSNLLDK